MTAKIAYSYDKITFEFTGETVADPDQLNEGEFLLPANSTLTEPPEFSENEIPVIDISTQVWTIKQDFRGSIYWDTEGNNSIISDIGVTVPEGSFSEEPDLRSLDQMKKDTISALKESHAEILRMLAGDETVEERETWPIKAAAAIAVSNSTASGYQLEMLTVEAAMELSTVESLVTKILKKNVDRHKMIGVASGHKTATTAAINAAETKEDLSVIVTEAKAASEVLVTQYLQEINNG